MATQAQIALATQRAEQTLITTGLVLDCEDGSIFTYETLFNGGTIFSFVSPSGERYTYQVEQTRTGQFEVSLLSGPSNLDDYRTIGDLACTGGTLTLTGTYTGDCLPVAAFRWLVDCLREGTPLPEGFRVVPSGYCRRCKKLLTVEQGPDSPGRKYNLGPVCFLKVFGGE